MIVLPEFLKSVPTGLAVRDRIGFNPSATGELVEVLARVHCEVCGVHQLRRHLHTLRAEADGGAGLL